MAPHGHPAATTALLQVTSVLLLAALVQPAGSRACDCLNWKQVYGEGLAECGEGAELFHFLARADVSARDARWIQRENPTWATICTEFFTKLDTDRCVNVAVHPHGRAGLPGSSWCYVSSDCRSLNGGSPLADVYSFFGVEVPLAWKLSALTTYVPPRAVSWKRCTRGVDPFLGDMPPGDLLELASQLNASSLWASRLAYAQHPGLWHEVEWSWREGDPEIMPAELRAALRKEEAAVVDEFPSGHHRILFGRDEWINYLGEVCDPPRGACWKKRPVGALA